MLFFRNLVALSATSVEVHWHDVGSVGWRAVEGPVEGTNFALAVGTVEPPVEGTNFASFGGTIEPPDGRPNFASVVGTIEPPVEPPVGVPIEPQVGSPVLTAS